MPAYDFECDVCHHVVELQRKMADCHKDEICRRPNTEIFDGIDICGGTLRRVGIDLTARMSESWKP